MDVQPLFMVLSVGAVIGLLQARVVGSIHHVRCTLRIAVASAFRNALVIILVLFLGEGFLGIAHLNMPSSLVLDFYFAAFGALAGALTAFLFFKIRDGFKISLADFAACSTVSGGIAGLLYALIFIPTVSG